MEKEDKKPEQKKLGSTYRHCGSLRVEHSPHLGGSNQGSGSDIAEPGYVDQGPTVGIL